MGVCVHTYFSCRHIVRLVQLYRVTDEDYYTMEPPLVGPYETGESRNMTVYEGTDGGYGYGYGNEIALRSTSGLVIYGQLIELAMIDLIT